MAYAAVASLLHTIDLTLNYHGNSASPELENQIISIHQHASFLQWFIEGASDRVNNWEQTIRQVSYKAEDIIELLLSDSLLESIVGRSELEEGKCEIRYSFDELERVTEEMESIAIRVSQRRRVTTGSDDTEVMEIVSLLVGGSAALEVIAICGGGGMGKTTLAGNADIHPLIVEHFDVRAWSPVTRDYTMRGLIGNLLRSMKAEFSTSSSEDELIQRLSQVLGRKRYRVVLDDVWSSDILERINVIFPDYGNGSRIIFTTRSFDLAKSAHHVHEMRLLDEDKSWNVLRERIFRGDPCPFQLESIGKSIARSCGGHLLSIVVVSGILAASDQSEAAWEDVSDNIKTASDVDEILYLGYMYLPHHLRPCLLFLVVSLEGRKIYVPTLVRLWVAEGFMKESGYKSLEETGEEYVEELVRRGLVSGNWYKSNGRSTKKIKVHDLIRGMCIRQAHTDNFILHLDRDTPGLDMKEIITTCRRVSSLNYCDDFLSGVYGSTIRTLIFFVEGSKLDFRCSIGNVKLLRILDLISVGSYCLSDKVFELFHLRYLSFNCDSNIPEAISNLQNLQTLVICNEKEGGVFDKLPEGIWRMPQLRHLCIISFKFPNGKGPSSAALENLQTLSTIVDFVCSREILKMFPNLKKLALLYTKNWKDVVEDYELHNLTHLRKLEILKIKTSLSIGEMHKMRCATFPPTLEKLSLHGLQLSWDDMNIIASLPNLRVLKLRNHACVGDTWETIEGGFSSLVFLRIEESNLENWITKSSHFPRLWQLEVVRCSSLLEVPYEMAEISTLKYIYLDDSNHPLWRSAQRIQKNRHSLGHYPIHVRLM